jgi:hypothetical protein
VKPGDRVRVDMTGLYRAMCAECGSVALFVPGGWCVRCSAPEGALIADPELLDHGHGFGRKAEGVGVAEGDVESDLDASPENIEPVMTPVAVTPSPISMPGTRSPDRSTTTLWPICATGIYVS